MFGIQVITIINNGRQFTNPKFKGLCKRHNIGTKPTSIAHPQANGEAIKEKSAQSKSS